MATRKSRPPEYGQDFKIRLLCAKCRRAWDDYSLADLASAELEDHRFCPDSCGAKKIPDDPYEALRRAASAFLAALQAIEPYQSFERVSQNQRWTVAELFAPDPVARAEAQELLRTQYGLSEKEIEKLTGAAGDQVRARGRLTSAAFAPLRDALNATPPRFGSATAKRIAEMCGEDAEYLHDAIEAAAKVRGHKAQWAAARRACDEAKSAMVRKQPGRR